MTSIDHDSNCPSAPPAPSASFLPSASFPTRGPSLFKPPRGLLCSLSLEACALQCWSQEANWVASRKSTSGTSEMHSQGTLKQDVGSTVSGEHMEEGSHPRESWRRTGRGLSAPSWAANKFQAATQTKPVSGLIWKWDPACKDRATQTGWTLVARSCHTLFPSVKATFTASPHPTLCP